jgi:NitT/TauT family transport system substrate-binding protein
MCLYNINFLINLPRREKVKKNMKGKKIMGFFFIGIVFLAGITTGVILYENAKVYDVRIGYLEGDLHQLAFYVARENEYYEEAGLNITAVPFANGGAVMAAFETPKLTRSIDMSYLGFAPALYHRFNNPAANIKVLASVNTNGSSLIVRDDGSILEAADLEGTIIAVPARHNMQDFILSMILAEAGLTHDDLENIVVMGPSDMILALQNEEIDGYVAWEPHNVKGTTPTVGGTYLYNSSQVWADHPCCVVASSEDFLESDPKTAQKVIEVHKRATQWILDNPEAAKTIAMEKMNLSAEQASQAMANIGYVYENNIVKMTEFVDKLVDLNPNVGFDSENIPKDITDSAKFIEYYIDESILEAIA